MGLILTEQQVSAADDMAAWGAEAIPGLQVTELHGQSERTARLMARAAEAEQRELKLADMLHEQQRLNSLLQMKLDAAVAMRQSAERKLAERPVAEVKHDWSPAPNCTMVDIRLPGGTKAIVEAYYRPGTRATDVDPGEGVECWADRVLIATKHGDRLVSVVDLCAALQDDIAVLRAVEAA